MKPLILAAAALLSAGRVLAAPDPRFDGRAGLPGPSAGSADAPAAPASAAPAAAPVDGRLWVVLAAGDAKSRGLAADAGVSIEELRPGRIGGFAAPRALARARAAGLKVI